jgi:hypothetical protein
MLEMPQDSTVREVRKRLKEIEAQLKKFDDLIRERQHLRGLLGFYEQGPNAGATLPRPAAVEVPQPQRLPLRFQPQANSRTTRLARAFRAVLERVPNGKASFVDVLDLIPNDLIGTGAHAREQARTAIKRAGHRYGVVYADGKVSLGGNKAASG